MHPLPGTAPSGRRQESPEDSGKDMQAGRDTDVQEFLDAHPFSPFQWVIFAQVSRGK